MHSTIKSIDDLQQLKLKREHEIDIKYNLDTNPIHVSLNYFFKKQLIRFNHRQNCPELFTNGYWLNLKEAAMRNGQVRHLLEMEYGWVGLEQKEKTAVMRLAVEDLSLFNIDDSEIKFDQNIMYLSNGLYDIKTKTFSRNTEIKDLYNRVGFKHYLNLNYDPESAYDPILDKLFNLLSSTPDLFTTAEERIEQRRLKKELIIGILGNVLTYKPARMIVNTFGDAGTGKSSFYQVIESLLADQATSVNYEDLVKDAHGTVQLVNKTMCYQPESMVTLTPTMVGLMKSLSSGDSLKVNEKHGAIYSIQNTAKPFINSNEVLNFRDSSGAMQSRLIPIAFNAKVGHEYWLTQQEYAALFPNGRLRASALNWLIKICVEGYMTDKQIQDQVLLVKESNILKKNIMDKASPISAWLEETTPWASPDPLITPWFNGLSPDGYIIEGTIAKVSAKELYTKYAQYEREVTGVDERYVMTQSSFGAKILSVLNSYPMWLGLGQWTKRKSGTYYYEFTATKGRF